MDHAITAKDVLITLGVLGGIVVVFGGLWVILDLLNPFRSGH